MKSALAALTALALLSASPAAAQSPAPAAAIAPAPRPADVASPDAIIAALYQVISGDAGAPRDWDRFRSLFHPSARLIPAGRSARALTPEDYIRTNGPLLLQRGFHERELNRRTERFGPLLHAWSTYEAKSKLTDAKPLARGINSIQLFHDGARWQVLTIAWAAETPERPLPAADLPRR